MSWKKNMLHSKIFSTKENPNKKPYNTLNYQQNQKPVLKIISGFNSYGLKTFADFLKWYNDLDVTPMIHAIENMNEFYKNIHIDFIHQAIPIPGVAMRVRF